MGKYITLNHLDQTVWSLLQKIDAKTDDRISDEDITKWNSPISYDSLTNKPYIPTSQDITNGAEYTVLHGNYPVSTFQNDMGYLTSYTETDPTVPSWAKASSKPTYTAAEVGALPDTTVIPEDKVFIATYGTTSYADTLAAYNAGKLIFGVYNPNSSNGPGKLIIPLTSYSSAQFQFEGKYLLGRSDLKALYLQSSGWSVSTFLGDITNRSADIESGDSLIIRDVSGGYAGGYVNKYSTLTFGTSTNQYLANNGTWQTLPDIAGFSVSVVQTLPAENIDDHTIYFLSNNGDSGNVYDEYMYVNNTWEIIGSTEVDLSNYLQKTEIADWAKAATKPTYTASEVGAVAKSGDTMTGNLNMGSHSIIFTNTNADSDATTTLWQTSASSGYGDERYGYLYINGRVQCNSTPTYNYDLTNKQYVDNKVSSLTAADVGALPDTTVIPTVPTNVSDFINDAGYLTSYTETDPMFAASAASGITDTDITNWNNKLSSYTETDPTVPAWAKAETKPTYTAQEVGALPADTEIPIIPTNISAFNNDTGYLTSYTETDPTVPVWAKASSKPTYTAAEVGALSDTTKYVSDVILVNHGEDLRVKYSDGTYQNVLQISSHIHNTLQTTAGSNNTEYNLIGTETSNANNTAVNIYNPGSISFAKTANEARLTLGSSSLPGKLRLYSSTNSASGFTDLISGASSTNERTITLPDATGTVALTSDIPNVPSWALAANKPTYTAAEVGATTSSDVSGMISSAVSGITSFSMEVVSSLPATGVAGRIYFVTGNNNTNDIYEEYIYVNNSWEKLGNFDATNVDLSGYLQTGDIAAWAKAANKPSYTANEVGALPSNTTYVSSFNGESGAITYIPPVTSVNGQTGAVTITDSDEKVKYTPLSGSDTNIYGVLLAQNNGGTEATTTAYSGRLRFQPSEGKISYYSSRGNRVGSLSYKNLNLTHDISSYGGTLQIDNLTASRTYTLPDQTGTIALTSDIPTTASDVGALPSDTTYVSSINGQTGDVTLTIPAADDHKWNDVALTKSVTTSTSDQFIPTLNGTTATSANLIKALSGATTAYSLAQRDGNGYIVAATPASGDSSHRVATTEFVGTAIAAITASDVGAVPTVGGTLTGTLTVSANTNGKIVFQDNNADYGATTTLQQTTMTVQSEVMGYLLINGRAAINQTPTFDTAIVNKQYVDNKFSSISVPQPYNATTNPTGYLTINDLPIYDGTVI